MGERLGGVRGEGGKKKKGQQEQQCQIKSERGFKRVVTCVYIFSVIIRRMTYLCFCNITLLYLGPL